MYTLLQWNVLAGFVIQRLAKEAHIDPKLLPSEDVRVTKILEILKQQNADVINLQEVDNDMLRALVNSFAAGTANYRIVGVINNRISTLSANSVYNNFTTVTLFNAAKFSLVGCRLIDMKTVRPLMRVSLQDNNSKRLVHVFNAHFPFAQGSDARYTCAEILVHEMKRAIAEFPGSLVVFSGDSNLIESSKRTPETLKMIAKNFIIKPDPKTPTYHAWPYERKELQKKTPGALDYVVASAPFAIEVIWANMMPFSFPMSDHCMIRADFL